MSNTLLATDNLVSLSNSGVKRYGELQFNDKNTSGFVCVWNVFRRNKVVLT